MFHSLRLSRSVFSLFCIVVIFNAAVDLINANDKTDSSVGKNKVVDEVSYHRDILPLLSTRCFLCHGPDEGTREAELRLDNRDDAIRDRDGMFVIKPGDPAASDIIARLITKDEDLLMPPPDSGHEPLTPKQIDLIRRWIAQDAPWSAHWAFTPPLRPKVPSVKQSEWVKNPIDAFILRKLEKEGLKPAPEANSVTLLRRLSLNLIGLPPTIKELDDHLANKKLNSFSRQVERLLDSPHYGERWGRVWLDAARYADSDGFEKDKPREVWFYRDWVINAFNQDMPYDQFIIEQIAGDLLPHATQDQIVATGFLRNSMLNEEGGIDPEEFRVQAMFDRMDTIGKSIMGITVQCGQCHSHKYDPFTQRDYYQMFAFLNNCHEAQPTVYTTKQQIIRDEISREIRTIENQLRKNYPQWQEDMSIWEKSVLNIQPKWTILPIKHRGSNSQRYYRQQDGSLLAQGYAPTKSDPTFIVTTDLNEIRSFRLETLNHPNLPGNGPGRSYDGQFALSEFSAKARSVKNPKKKITVKFTRATADFSNKRKQLTKPFTDKEGKNAGFTGSVEYAIDGDPKTAWGIDAGPGQTNQPRKAFFVADKNVAFPGGTKLEITLSQNHGGWNSDENQTMNLGRFRLSVTGVETVADPVPSVVRKIMDVPIDKRNADQMNVIFTYWRTTVPEWKQANDQIVALWKKHPKGTTQFTLQERPKLRKTHLLNRGDFLKPGDQVTANVPGFLNPMASNSKTADRLSFAKWLVDRKSPTAARSIINRIWQAHFGTGLVTTPEDLGSTGSSPSHPELLDWLSVELMDNDWSLKHIHRLIVQSNTFRQSSKVSTELLKRDPENLLLARGARFRVDAEIVRDIFLASSGLLTKTIGGPSVYPPAPAFLFQRPASYGPKTWNVETGPNKYRRALYTFRFRSVPYPALQTFDAPSGEIATVHRSRSNSPLQALTTLNEPLFVECAQALARKTVISGTKSDVERLNYAFRSCVARQPTKQESDLLLKMLTDQKIRFKNGTLDSKLILATNKKKSDLPILPAGVTSDELAAWTVVCRVLLNLDETITNE